MKFVVVILFFIFNACDFKPPGSISVDSSDVLKANVQNLELIHISWDAWLKPVDLEKGKNTGSLDSFVVYLERPNELLKFQMIPWQGVLPLSLPGNSIKKKAFLNGSIDIFPKSSK